MPGGLFCAGGNPLNDGTWTYTWEKGRQLRRMSKNDSTVEFKYNENGLRIQKVLNPDTANEVVTNYTLHGKNIVHMTQGSNNLHFFYDASNKPAIVEFNGTKYAYVHNLQGDIVAILDSNGTAVVQYKYDAWGRQIGCDVEAGNSNATALSTLNPFRYRGYVYDEETGLYYLRSRYYNPNCCRFINTDVLLGKIGSLLSTNPVAYCANSPIAYADNDGLEADECEHAYFKNTYYLSGEAFQEYLDGLYSRHPDKHPNPPVVDSGAEALQFLGSTVASEMNPESTSSIENFLSSVPIIGHFVNYDNDIENYILGRMLKDCSRGDGYQAVKIDLLYGSHSAEVKLTLATQSGDIVSFDPIITQGYNVILNMMDSMKSLVDKYGGTYLHEGVSTMYSMAE